MRAILRSLRPRVAWVLLGLLGSTTVAAVDAEFSWASLSAEQRYVLQRYAGQWSRASVASRRTMVMRANAMLVASRAKSGRSEPAGEAGLGESVAEDEGVSTARDKAHADSPRRKPVASQTARLSSSEAVLSAHSSKLRARLRETPGLSLAERKDVLERWSKLSPRERIALVERYAKTYIDNEEITLQRALREGTIRASKLQRGLVTERITPRDAAAAMRDGKLSTKTLRAALPDDLDVAFEIETAARTGEDPPPLDGRLTDTVRRYRQQGGDLASSSKPTDRPITDIRKAAASTAAGRVERRER